MHTSSVRIVLLFTMLLATPFSQALDSGDCTPIISIPFEITEPGRYCLTDNLDTNLTGGKAIVVKADHVTIDFNHFRLSTSVFRKGNAATGIYASGRDYLKIHGGTLGGWATGIRIDGPGSTGNTISSMHFNDITKTGIEAKGIGLYLYKNRFAMIGRSTRFADATAIDVSGTSPQIIGNTIRDVMTNTGFAIGMKLTDTENPVLQDNYFDTIDDPKSGCGVSLMSTTNALLLRNNFQGMYQGIVLKDSSTGLSNDTFMQGVDIPTFGDGLIFIGHNF